MRILGEIAPLGANARHVRPWQVLTFFTLLAIAVTSARAQSLYAVPSPNGPVYALATIGNIAYVGGAFDKLGVYTGGGAALDVANGHIQSGSPAFRALGSSFAYPGGLITVAIPDGSGGWFVGGDFVRLGGISRPYVAHVDANRNVLPWAPPAPNGSVWSLLLSGTTLYIGGDFTALGATARSHLAAVNATTGALSSFDPGAENRVSALALSGGTLFVGGSFGALAGQTRYGLGAVNAATGVATGWNPDLPLYSSVETIVLGVGVAYVGGSFSSVQGIARANLAAVDLATGAPTTWTPNANGVVHSLVSNGASVYAGGQFTSIGGKSKSFVAQLNTTNGNASATWNAACDDYVYQLCLDGGTLYVAGAFTALGGQPRAKIGAIDATTALATSWAPVVDGNVWSVAASGSGIWIGGLFQWAESIPRRGLAAIDLVTRTVMPWNPDVNGTVRSLATNGTMLYVGGSFSQAGGLARNSLAAYALPSAIPTAFDAAVNQGSPSSPTIYALSLEPGVLRVGGYFERLGGQVRDYAGAVDPATGLATPWAPEPNTQVRAIQPSGGSVYLAGAFSTVGGESRPLLAQVDAVTGAATSWVPPVFFGGYSSGGHPIPANLFALAEKAGVLYVGGAFQSVGGQLRANAAALDPSGAVLPWAVSGSYYPDANVGTTALNTEGPSVLAAATGLLGTGFRVLDPTTGAAAAWPPAMGGGQAVDRAGGYMLVGGEFLDAGDVPAPHLAVFLDPAFLDVGEPPGTTRPLALARPVPNPARIASTVSWTLTHRSVVSIALFDLAGRRVRTVVDLVELPTGAHTRTLDVASLAPGLYLLHAEIEGARETRKLMIAH